MGAVSAQPTPTVVADPQTTIAAPRPAPAWIGFGVVLGSAALFGMLGPLSRFAYDAGMEPAAFVAWRALIGLAAVERRMWPGASTAPASASCGRASCPGG